VSNKIPRPPRRLTPEARRRQILTAARALFAEHREQSVSTADVAVAAGVTRALVHHYFHGIEELRDAVAMEIAQSAAPLLAPDHGVSIEERVRANVSTFLDAVEANRDAWLATIGGEGGANTAAGRALRQAMLERMLTNNADTIDDTPWARLCLNGYIGFSDAIVRQWVLEHRPRAEAERALSATLLHLLQETISAGQARTPHRMSAPQRSSGKGVRKVNDKALQPDHDPACPSRSRIDQRTGQLADGAAP
jgi:AcrR family transcriptional regulator